MPGKTSITVRCLLYTSLLLFKPSFLCFFLFKPSKFLFFFPSTLISSLQDINLVTLSFLKQLNCAMFLLVVELFDFAQERARAQEERMRNISEYRKFLESCDFIKVFVFFRFHLFSAGFICQCSTDLLLSLIQASTQWRKVQDRLEADERCSRLEKIDRLEIFQVIVYTKFLNHLIWQLS